MGVPGFNPGQQMTMFLLSFLRIDQPTKTVYKITITKNTNSNT